jgi:hypothetical protein
MPRIDKPPKSKIKVIREAGNEYIQVFVLLNLVSCLSNFAHDEAIDNQR